MALLVIAQNSAATLFCVALAFFVELLRVAVAYILGSRKTAQVRQLTKEKLALKLELGKIKSVQAELVKKSKLERKLIATERSIETLKEDVLPQLQRSVKSAFRIIRIVVYGAISLACFNIDLVVVDSNLFFPFVPWPFAFPLINLPAWGVIIITSLASRHLIRTVLPLLSSETIV